jgi:hypothetical protein
MADNCSGWQLQWWTTAVTSHATDNDTMVYNCKAHELRNKGGLSIAACKRFFIFFIESGSFKSLQGSSCVPEREEKKKKKPHLL